jgi:hypothetical protein
MDKITACSVIQEIQAEMGEGLLETLQYMKDNFDQFEQRQQVAFYMVFGEMRKLFFAD